MKIELALVMTIASASAFSEESIRWSQVDRDIAAKGCARAIAEPAFSDYLRRHNLPDPDPRQRKEAIERAMATDGPIWAICACVMDEVSKRWPLSAVAKGQLEVTALIKELSDGRCKPTL